MKSFRWTLLFALLALGLVVFTFFDFKRGEEQALESERGLLLLKIPAGDVTHVELLTKTLTTVLQKTDEKWEVVSPFRDLADSEAVTAFIRELTDAKATETVVEGPSLDLKMYGLEDPVGRVKLSGGSLQQEVKIGSVKAYDGSLYAQVDTENRVRLVPSSWDTYLVKPARDFRDKHLFRERDKIPEIKRVVVKQRLGSAVTELELKKGERGWRLGKWGLDYPLVQETAAAFVQQVKSLEGEEVTDEPKPAQPTKLGFDKPQVEVRAYADGAEPAITALIASPIEDKTKPPPVGSDPATPSNVYAWSSELPVLLKMSPYVADALKKTPQDFYDKKLPFQFDVKNVSRMRIESPNVKGEFAKKGDSWVPTDGSLQTDIDVTKLNDLLTKVARLEAVRILGPAGANEAFASRIVFLNEAREKVFEFEWGDLVTEKGVNGAPDMTYLKGRTSQLDFFLGIPELSVRSLSIKKEGASP